MINSEITAKHGQTYEEVCLDAVGYYIPITFEWKKVSKRETEDMDVYVVDDKDNAIVCKFSDRIVEIPVEFYCSTPVASLELVNNKLEKGVYSENSIYYYLEGIVVKINYVDGSSKEVTWKKGDNGFLGKEIDDGYLQKLRFKTDWTSNSKKRNGKFEYMGVSVNVPYKIIESPIKELKLIKQPKKITYAIQAVYTDIDFYGLQFYIVYKDGSKQKVTVNKHVNELSVKLNKKDALDQTYTGDFSYYDNKGITIQIHEAELYIPTKTDISSMGKSKKITVDKKSKITFSKNALTKLLKVVPQKTGKYSLTVDGQWIDAVSGKKKNETDVPIKKIGIFTYEGFCWYNDHLFSMKDETDEFSLKKGESYYIYIDAYSSNYYAEPEMNLSLKVNMAYKGELEDPELQVEDMTAAYSTKNLSVSKDYNCLSEGTFSYESSNKKVAVVSDTGKITIKGMGTTKITVKLSASGCFKSAKKIMTLTVVPDKMELSSVKSTKSKQMTVQWKSQKKATGYVIQYSTDSKFKKNVQEKVVTGGSKTKVTLKNLTKGKKYYVRIKAYTSVNSKKVFGKVSKTINVKVK